MMTILSHTEKHRHDGRLNQSKHLCEQYAEILKNADKNAVGGSEHRADGSVERKLNIDNAWNYGEAQNKACYSRNSNVKESIDIGGVLANYGWKTKKSEASQGDNSARDGLAGAGSSTRATNSAGYNQPLQVWIDEGAVGHWICGCKEDQSNEEKGRDAVISHLEVLRVFMCVINLLSNAICICCVQIM